MCQIGHNKLTLQFQIAVADKWRLTVCLAESQSGKAKHGNDREKDGRMIGQRKRHRGRGERVG